MNAEEQLLVKLIGQYGTNLNNFKILKSLHNTLMNSRLSNDLKVSINDIYVGVIDGDIKNSKRDMLLLLNEVQNRLNDGYGLLQFHYTKN